MDCVEYSLALPGLARRELRIPHPVAFERLTGIIARHFARLLRKAHRSPFSRSAPKYDTTTYRAIQPGLRPTNLPRERATARTGASFLLKTDISHFYPSLYTHAVGWAIDPSLRKRAQWRNYRLLGKKIDQALMDTQGKVSQGIPIGNDLSFLLAEVVLSDVDQALALTRHRAFRWYDDYEIACDTRAEAERVLAALTKELARFRLRLNPAKTTIESLPKPAEDEWRDLLLEGARHRLSTGRDMVQFFDLAFRLHSTYPHSAVLVYALGMLFQMRRPQRDAQKVALSCITQILMAEPGVAQKAFALLSFWSLNGLVIDHAPLAATVARMISNHEDAGLSSDVAWALFFCLETGMRLDRSSAAQLSEFEDDAIAILACDMGASGLLGRGFSRTRLAAQVRTLDPDGSHWLAAYEFVRQGLGRNPGISTHPVFSEMLQRDVAFYRSPGSLPPYASLLHPGGAPEWIASALLRPTSDEPLEREADVVTGSPVVALIQADVRKLKPQPRTKDDLVAELFGGDFKRFVTATLESDEYA